MKSVTRIPAILVTLTLIFALAACGNTGNTNAQSSGNTKATSSAVDKSNETSKEAKPIKFTYSTIISDGTKDIIGAALAEYQKTHPELTMETQVTGSDSYLQKMQVASNANTLPDLFWWNGFNLVENMDKFPDSYVDLSPYYDDAFKSTLANGALDLLTTKSGKITSFPADMQIQVWVHNKALFDKYGLTIPTTDEELKACVPVFKKNGIATIAFGSKDLWPVWGIEQWYNNWGMWEQGDDLFLSPPKVKTKDAGYVNVWRFEAELFKLGAFPEHNSTMTFDQMLNLYTSGKAAIISLSSDQMGKLLGTPVEKDSVLTWGIKFKDSPYDQNIGIKSVNNGYAIGAGAAKDKDKLDAIIAFNKWRFSNEGVVAELKAGFMMPVKLDMDLSQFSTIVQQQVALLGDSNKASLPSIWSAYFRWDKNGDFITKFYAISNVLENALTDGSKTEKDIDEACEKLDKVIEEAIKTLKK
jgi:ABC-type sugar transport system, periplasmic component